MSLNHDRTMLTRFSGRYFQLVSLTEPIVFVALYSSLLSGTLIVKGFGFDTLETTLMQIPYGAIITLT